MVLLVINQVVFRYFGNDFSCCRRCLGVTDTAIQSFWPVFMSQNHIVANINVSIHNDIAR